MIENPLLDGSAYDDPLSRKMGEAEACARVDVTRADETSALTLSHQLTSVESLVSRSLIDVTHLDEIYAVAARYSIAVTPDAAALIDSNDPRDPIARQFIPDARELVLQPQEMADPIGDNAHSPTPGVVHRYRDRVLLKLLTVCPVYCRFCFRRETVGRGKGDVLPERDVDAALDYIGAHPEIFEVILTGGDPLMLSARRLAAVARRLAAVPHVKLLRVHTRAPTVAPELASADRLAALSESRKALCVALHVNHPRELTDAARAAIVRLRDAGAMLLSQTVLLRGVNDDASTLEQLMRALLASGVKPYYLHHPDLAPGTAHFRLPLAEGRVIYGELARRVTGVGLPAYVLDIPGGFGKVRIMEGAVEPDGQGGWRVVDRFGAIHTYRDVPPQD